VTILVLLTANSLCGSWTLFTPRHHNSLPLRHWGTCLNSVVSWYPAGIFLDIVGIVIYIYSLLSSWVSWCMLTLLTFTGVSRWLSDVDCVQFAIRCVYIVYNMLFVVAYNNNNEKFTLRHKMQNKLRGAVHCTSAKHMTSILKHVAEAFPPARQGTILNSHRVIGIATNRPTSMVLNCDLVTGCSLTSYPGHNYL